MSFGDSVFDWPDEVVAELRTLWDAKLSARQCADAINEKFGLTLSRNAVLGKANRLHMPSPLRNTGNGQPKKKYKKRKAKAERILGNLKQGRDAFDDGNRESIRSSLDPDDIPIEQRKQLFDLRSEDCRWPYGDPGAPDFFFCGAAPIQSGCSYCTFHRSVAVGRGIAALTVEEIERRQQQGRRMAARNNRKAA